MGKLISILIQKWSSRLGPDEESALKELMATEEGREEIAVYEKIWNESDHYRQSYVPDTDAAWNRFKTQIQTEPTPAHSSWRWLLLIGILILAGFGIWYVSTGPTVEEALDQGPYATLEDEMRSFALIDGSEVTLNQSSTLKLIEQKNGEQVYQLKGEGYFSIVPDPARRFVILAGNARVEVLGTSFNLRVGEDDGRTEVEVEEGKVAFYDLQTNTRQEVGRMERAICGPGVEMEKRKIGRLNAQSWRTGELYFDGITIVDAAPDLERFYGVSLQLSPEVLNNNCPISYKVDRNIPVEDVLEALQVYSGIEYDSPGKDVFRLYGGLACD